MDVSLTQPVMEAQSAALRHTIDMAVAGKQLDSLKIQGAAVLKMLQASAMPPSPEGVGNHIDTYA